jgi:hypothetical protein
MTDPWKMRKARKGALKSIGILPTPDLIIQVGDGPDAGRRVIVPLTLANLKSLRWLLDELDKSTAEGSDR